MPHPRQPKGRKCLVESRGDTRDTIRTSFALPLEPVARLSKLPGSDTPDKISAWPFRVATGGLANGVPPIRANAHRFGPRLQGPPRVGRCWQTALGQILWAVVPAH